MGEVFEATLTSSGGFEKRVALKLLLPHLARDEHFVAMFLNEARIAAKLSHPNICNVYEVGEADGSYYIAMELLQGQTVAQLLQRARGPLPLELVVAIVRQASAGLQSAHELRDSAGNSLHVIHRDVTPSNIFVTSSGRVKILDFGVAKARDAMYKTQVGTLKGKFGYMSPEQLRALELDRRSDVFCLGICTHEMLTGRRLFNRSSIVEATMAILEDEIPTLADAGQPEAVSAVVDKALKRDRESRYSTVRAFAEALERAAKVNVMSRKQVTAYVDDMPPASRKKTDALEDDTVNTDGDQPVMTVIDKAPTPLPVMAAIPRSSPSERISDVVPAEDMKISSDSLMPTIIGAVLFFGAVALVAYLLAS
jgi:serine/threonine-protein kinase